MAGLGRVGQSGGQVSGPALLDGGNRMSKATKAAAPQIAIGDRVTVPPLPGMPGLPGVWLVEGVMLCGSTTYFLLPHQGGWWIVDAARCVLATGAAKASA